MQRPVRGGHLTLKVGESYNTSYYSSVACGNCVSFSLRGGGGERDAQLILIPLFMAIMNILLHCYFGLTKTTLLD